MAESAQALASQWNRLAGDAAKAWEEFRQTRLFVQVLLSLGLVVFAWVSTLPLGPLERLEGELRRMVRYDYDFKGKATAAQEWATGRGGWGPALAGVWQEGTERLRTWAGIPEAPGSASAETQAETVLEPEEPAAESPVPRTVMPVAGPVLFGYGWLPRDKQVHEGLDLAAAVGDPVAAIAAGTVLKVSVNDVLGACVEVDHGFVIVLYGQVSGVKVKTGDQVRQGQTLAVIAKPTGKEGDGASHLHLEVRPSRGAKSVDPAPYLPLEDATRGGTGI